MGMFDKRLTIEDKENIKKLMCDFIDNLGENDYLTIGGDTKVETFTGKGEKHMCVIGKQFFK